MVGFKGRKGSKKGSWKGFKTKTLQTATLRVAILSDSSARRLSQNFGAKLKQKSAQVRAVFSWKFAVAQNCHLQCCRLRCFIRDGPTATTTIFEFISRGPIFYFWGTPG